MDKITFTNGVTKVNADTFNTFQDNIDNAITAVDGKTVASGGTTGQILKKNSDTDYDATWQDQIEVVDNLTSESSTSALSANQGKTLKDLIDKMYYKAGDTYLTSAIIVTGGYVTSSKKQLWFSVTLPKRLDNITTVNITSLNIDVRSVSGTYIVSDQSLPTSSMGVGARIGDKNTITIIVSNTSDFYQTNNTPIGVQINTLGLSFS